MTRAVSAATGPADDKVVVGIMGVNRVTASLPEFVIEVEGLSWATSATLKVTEYNRLFWLFT